MLGKAVDTHAATYKAVVRVERANVYVQPDAASKILMEATKGQSFKGLGPSPDGRWVHIELRGRRGWISVVSVQIREDGAQRNPVRDDANTSPKVKEVSKEADATLRWTTVVRDSTLRLGPAAMAPVVVEVFKGDVARFIGFSRDQKFVRIEMSDGSQGWLPKAGVVPGVRKDLATPGKKTRSKREGPSVTYFRSRSPVARPSFALNLVPAGLSIQQKVETESIGGVEGFGYKLSALAAGPIIHFSWTLIGNVGGGSLDMNGAYLGAKVSQLPAPNVEHEVLLDAVFQRADLGFTYRIPLGSAFALFAYLGYRHDNFYVQPQTLSFYFTNHYHGLRGDLGGDVSLMSGALVIEFAMGSLVPSVLVESFGAGQAGSSGDKPETLGGSARLALLYRGLPRGFGLGLHLDGTYYQTQFFGEGQRAGTYFSNALTSDQVLLAGLILHKGF